MGYFNTEKYLGDTTYLNQKYKFDLKVETAQQWENNRISGPSVKVIGVNAIML